MTLKQRINKWLGTEEALKAHFEAHLSQALEQHSKASARAQEKALAEQRADYENRAGLVLEAAMTASEKIARIVSERGDRMLREYVQEQLMVLEHAATGQLIH